MATPAPQLTPQQIAAYWRDGYLVLGPLAPPEEIAAVRAVYDRQFAARVGREEGRQFDLFGDDSDPDRPNVPQILGLSQDAPELRETALWRNARAVYAQLFGCEPDYMGDHAINKPARCPLATPWHQDEAYWGADHDHCAASLWIPLQDVDARTGCMHFVPRSHWGEILPHRSAGNDPRVHGLELDGDFAPLLAGAVACPLPAGGCTIHHQRTLHYASPNAGDQDRRAWIIGAGMTPRRRHEARPVPWNDAKRTLRTQREREHQARRTAAAAGPTAT